MSTTTWVALSLMALAILTMPIKKMVLEYSTAGLQLEATAMLAQYS